MFIRVITWKDRVQPATDLRSKRVRDWGEEIYHLRDGHEHDMEEFNSHVYRCKAMIHSGYITGANVALCYQSDSYNVCWCSGFGCDEEWISYEES